MLGTLLAMLIQSARWYGWIERQIGFLLGCSPTHPHVCCRLLHKGYGSQGQAICLRCKLICNMKGIDCDMEMEVIKMIDWMQHVRFMCHRYSAPRMEIQS